MKIGVVGLGLIGGSFAIHARKHFANAQLLGSDHNQTHQEQALSLGLIDGVLSSEDYKDLELLLLAIPVDAIEQHLTQFLDQIGPKGLIIDFGSTKAAICQQVAKHPKRKQFLATHPIAGTEFSGPTAAFESLYFKKTQILCETEKTNPELLLLAKTWFEAMQMELREMDPVEHDRHIAYVSHLSHISSFMLGKTVLEKEKDQSTIFDMAGSGFESTVRLAKSSPDMWTPIFKINKNFVLESLNDYIRNLKTFKAAMERDDFEVLYQEMKQINRIKTILKGITDKNNTYGK